MITVQTLPRVESNEHSRWGLVIWIGQAFDYDAPLRAVVQQVADLFHDTGASVELPLWEVGEDFIVGRVVAGSHHFDVYLEYALSYIAFSAAEEAPMREVEQRLCSLTCLSMTG